MYATRDDLIARFGVQEIEKLEKTTSKVVDPAVSNTALLGAEELANSFIAVKYDLPLKAIPDALKGYVLDIARYKLYTQKPTEEVRQRYDDAMGWLKGLAAGRSVLILPADPDTDTPVGEAGKNQSRIAVGSSHTGGVFGTQVTDLMPMLMPGSSGFGGFDG